MTKKSCQIPFLTLHSTVGNYRSGTIENFYYNFVTAGLKTQEPSSQGYPQQASPASQPMQLPGQQNIPPSSLAAPATSSYAQQTQYPQQATQAPSQSYAPTSTQTQSTYPGMASATAATYPASQSQQPYGQTSQQSYTPQSQSYSAAGVTPYSGSGQTQTQYQAGYQQQQQQQPQPQSQQQPAAQSGYGGTQGSMYPSNQQYPQQPAYNQYNYNYQQQQTYPNY